MIGIYKIENLVNGKIYIGQSQNIERRWREHKREDNIFECVKDCVEFYNINYRTMVGWLNGHNKIPKEFIDKGLRYL